MIYSKKRVFNTIPMYRRNFIQGFQKELDTLKKQNEDFSNDFRPVSGMVGQKCLCFYTDMYGKTIRVIPEEHGEEFVGPGSYSPNDPSKTSKSLKISSNSKRTEIINHSFPVGPTDHYQPLKMSKFPHKISGTPVSALKNSLFSGNQFLSGNMEHSTWSTPYNCNLPKRRFPQVHFKDNNNTPSFASNEARVLFPTSSDAISKDSESNVRKDTTINVSVHESPVFQDSVNRFPDVSSATPSPCHYNPSSLSQGRKTGLEPSWTIVDIDPPEITPGPGAYETDTLSPVMAKMKNRQSLNPPRSRVIPRNLLPKRNHPIYKSSQESPSPCSYDVHFEDTKIPILIRAKDKFKSNDWSATPELLTNTPKVGAYDLSANDISSCCINGRVKGGVMSIVGHRPPFEGRNSKENNHQFEFSTQHSSLLKKSYNARLYQTQ